MQSFIHLSIRFRLYTVLQCQSSMSSNFLVFHTSGGISSSPAAFLFLIFLSTEPSSTWVNDPSLLSNFLLIILVIILWVTFGGFPSKFLKYCFHMCVRSCWLVAFSLALLFLLLTSFIVCHDILDYSILNRVSNLIDLILYIYSDCSFRYILANLLSTFLSFKGIGIVWTIPIAFGGSFQDCTLFSNR